MTDFTSLLQADRGGTAHAIHLVDKKSFADWVKRQSQSRRAFLEAQRFEGKTPFQSAILPGETWYFQAWFRDKNPAATSNFSDAIAIAFL